MRVITAADIPGENKVGHLKHDQYSLIPIGGLTHYLGDAIALVVAETPEILEKAKKLVKVTYEPLPAVHNPPEAWAEDAPRVFDEEESNVQAYKHIARGDADTAIKTPNTSFRSISRRRGRSTRFWSRNAPSRTSTRMAM